MLVSIVLWLVECDGFSFGGFPRATFTVSRRGSGTASLEIELLDALAGVKGRRAGSGDTAAIDRAIAALEKDGGLPKPAMRPEVDGRWRLLYITTPSSASPIQRSFVGVDAFRIYQNIDLIAGEDAGRPPTVTNVVDFGGSVGQLRVQALASCAARPLDGFRPRRSDGRILGINVFGVSQIGPPKDPAARIDFQFDDAAFELNALPFKVPYPVPFRLLGDEVKGWIDITYLSPALRLSRGNKGTLFVLQREEGGA